MSHELLRSLRQMRKTEKRIVPDAAWVRATRATLLMQVKNSLPTAESITLQQQVRGTFKAFVPNNFGEWIRRPLIAFMSLITVLAGGSIMSVSAAEQALPGDLLYGLKLATEQARLAFTPVKEERLKLKTEFTSRRVDELKQVADDGQHPDRVVQVAEILKRDLDTLKQQLDEVVQEVPAANAAAAAKLVDQKSTEVINALQGTKSQLSPENIEKVTEAQSVAADTSVKAIEVLAEQHRQSNDVVPAEDVARAISDHVKVVTDVTSSTPAIVSTSTNPLIGTTSTQALTDIVTSSTSSTTTSALPILLGQMKDATTQAFAQQKVKDQLDVIAAASSTEAALLLASSSTFPGATDASSTALTTSSTLDAVSNTSTTMSSTTPSTQ